MGAMLKRLDLINITLINFFITGADKHSTIGLVAHVQSLKLKTASFLEKAYTCAHKKMYKI